jgi:hypothetical protein
MTYPSGAASLIVAAAPGDQRAAALAEALSASGWAVTLAVTPDVAARAAGQTCIVVLAPATWNHPAIATAVMSRPARLIPVLAEPMALPQGPWTSAPFTLSPDTARQILALLGPAPGAPASSGMSAGTPYPIPGQGMAPPSPSPPGGISSGATPAPGAGMGQAFGMPPGALHAPDLQPFRMPPVSPTPPIRRRSRFSNPAYWVSLIVIIAVIGIAAVLRNNNSTNNSGEVTTYSAAIPTCGSTSGDWHTLNAATTCQASSLLITRGSVNAELGETLFSPFDQVFPHSYEVQVTGAIVNGDSQANLGIIVHRQNDGGGQFFGVHAAGWWQVLQEGGAGSSGNSSQTRLNIGAVTKSSSYSLDVKVLGPQLTLSINGQQVGSVTDDTFSGTDAVSLAISDPGASGTLSVQFSNFSFKSLPDSSTSDSDLVATATAQAQQHFTTPYKATVPGQGCDTGGAAWANPAVFGAPVTASCTKSGLQLSQNSGNSLLYEAEFYLHDGTFPANYSVQVTIDVSKLNTGCAFVQTREQLAGGGYVFQICQGGTWEIDYFSTGGNQSTLDSGTVSAKSSYTLLATAKGSTQSLAIDGHQVAAPTESSLTATASIGLGILPPNGQSGSVIFSNFIFTPLS